MSTRGLQQMSTNGAEIKFFQLQNKNIQTLFTKQTLTKDLKVHCPMTTCFSGYFYHAFIFSTNVSGPSICQEKYIYREGS